MLVNLGLSSSLARLIMVVGEKEAVFFHLHPRPQKAVGLSQLSHALPSFGNGESVRCRQVGVLTVKKKEKESIGVAELAKLCHATFDSLLFMACPLYMKYYMPMSLCCHQ